MSNYKYDAVVVGSGPNGLAAAIALALNGLSVIVYEEKSCIGGGMRSEALTLPGYTHDVCSAIHPLAIGSPFLSKLPLEDHGLQWIHPSAPLAHPFDDGTCTLLERSLDKTCEGLGSDSSAYRALFSPIIQNWPHLEDTILGPLQIPRHPLEAIRFALKAIRPASNLARSYFKDPKTQALFAGLAAHSILPLDKMITGAAGLVLGALGHLYNWPMPQGGSQALANAMGAYFKSLGGTIITDTKITSIKELPSSRTVFFDLTPVQILSIAGDSLTASYKRQLENYRYGPGVFKMDWALDGPIPWKAAACQRAGTVHIGGSIEEIEESEKAIWKGKCVEKPYVLLAQQSLFDPSRAPMGKHTAWAYCHVPHSSMVDMTDRIETQIERFAPGFRDLILAKSTKNTQQMTQFNPNYIGGDITGGVQDIGQLFTRPVKRIVPYATANPRLYICSSSTPPGGGVHGMCGYHAARVALSRVFGIPFGWDAVNKKVNEKNDQ